MQLVTTISIPEKDGEIEVTAEKLKNFRKKGFPLEWYVFFAIQLSFPQKAPSISAAHFCEEWEILEHELDSAIAKLQKKGLLYRPSTTIQLELFEIQEEG